MLYVIEYVYATTYIRLLALVEVNHIWNDMSLIN